MTEPRIPPSVVDAYGLHDAVLEPITVGLINRTYRVSRGGTPTLVLQRLHPTFVAEVNEDLDAVTTHLDARGLPTPRLVRTSAGARHVEADGIYRALTWIEGRVVSEIGSSELASAAGALVGRFHRALDGFAHVFRSVRPGAHDTAAHLAKLRAALATSPDPATSSLGRDILEHATTLRGLEPAPSRVVHGDLKITNLLFDDARDEGRCVLDLDTMARGPLAIELGDAFRSWCNPRGESDVSAAIDPTLFAAAVEGYATAMDGHVEPAEWRSFAAATETIATELAARFCTDAIEDRYFGWDATRFASRVEHNRVRATSQLALARSIRDRREALDEAVARAFR